MVHCSIRRGAVEDGEAGRYSEPFTQPNDHTDPSPRDALVGETQTGVSVYQYSRSDERWEEVARPPDATLPDDSRSRMKIYDHQDGSGTVRIRRLSNVDVEHSNVRDEGSDRLLLLLLVLVLLLLLLPRLLQLLHYFWNF
jgi:hypothetical protein